MKGRGQTAKKEWKQPKRRALSFPARITDVVEFLGKTNNCLTTLISYNTYKKRISLTPEFANGVTKIRGDYHNNIFIYLHYIIIKVYYRMFRFNEGKLFGQ